MAGFDLERSLASAAARFGRPSRRPRIDKGRHRMSAETAARLSRLLGHQDPLPMRQLLAALAVPGSRRRAGPSRAAIYQFMARVRLHSHELDSLPAAVRDALYNLAGTTRVPGPQVVFYCFNYGGSSAMSFAAGLPWIDLYQAARMRGWRPKSLGLLTAVMRARGL